MPAVGMKFGARGLLLSLKHGMYGNIYNIYIYIVLASIDITMNTMLNFMCFC